MAKPFPWPTCVLFLSAIFWAVDLSIKPILLKIIINTADKADATNLLAQLILPITLYLLMDCLENTGHRMRGYFVFFKMIPKMRENITNHAIKCLTEKSHTYYQHNFSGSLSNKVGDLVKSVPELIDMIIDRFFAYIVALAIAIYTLGQVNIFFALFMAGWVCCFMGVYLLLRRHLRYLASTWAEQSSICIGKIVDFLSNVLSVRLFAAKFHERRLLAEATHTASNAERKFQWVNFWIWLFYGYSSVVLLGVGFYFLIKGRQEGWITIGDFALVIGINIAIREFLWQLAYQCLEFSKLFGRISQALKNILGTPEVRDVPGASKLVVRRGRIVFKKIKFHYKGTEPLFENKSVVIEAGQKVGLVGYSGSGKTTFVNMILRLYDVTGGKISIDGQDIRTVTQESLRAAISTIPQEPSLFHRSLMENIRYGQLNATDDEVIKAAKKAHAHEFIKSLPQGYDSLVGERGVKLSGGQRQRIAIARAVLKDAPILILDEATSQLDSVTENLIQKSLVDLMKNKTTIVVAHRLSTLLHMDRILVFNRGKIVEDGTHKSLLKLGGMYRILWSAQVGGFLPDSKK